MEPWGGREGFSSRPTAGARPHLACLLHSAHAPRRTSESRAERTGAHQLTITGSRCPVPTSAVTHGAWPHPLHTAASGSLRTSPSVTSYI